MGDAAPSASGLAFAAAGVGGDAFDAGVSFGGTGDIVAALGGLQAVAGFAGGGGPVALHMSGAALQEGSPAGIFHNGTRGASSGILRVAGSGGVHSSLTGRPSTQALDVGRGTSVVEGNSSLFTGALLGVGGTAAVAPLAFLLGLGTVSGDPYTSVSAVDALENSAGEISLSGSQHAHQKQIHTHIKPHNMVCYNMICNFPSIT